jgi:hypothetical protein
MTQKIVLAKHEKIRVRSEKFHGGAGLKRWKRYRGFLQFSLDTENYTVITDFFQGLNREKLETASHGGRRVL